MNSLLLNTETWDLSIDGSKNIAVATEHYAITQNVATALRVVLGEQMFQGNIGIPYFNILGNNVPLSYLRNLMEKTALSINGVVSAKCIINFYENRQLKGNVLIIDNLGNESNVNF